MTELLELDECLSDVGSEYIDQDDASIMSGEIDVEVTEPRSRQLPKGALKLVENDDISEGDIRDLDNASVASDNIIPKTLRKKEKITQEDIEVHDILESKHRERKNIQRVKDELDDPAMSEERHKLVGILRQYLEDEFIGKVADLSIIPDEYEALPYESLKRIRDTIKQQLGRGATTRFYRQAASLMPSTIEMGGNWILGSSGIKFNGFTKLLGANRHYQASVSEYIIDNCQESYSDPLTRIGFDMLATAAQIGVINLLGAGEGFAEVTPESVTKEFNTLINEPME